MSQFHCKYCSRPMPVSFLEYSSNSYCNKCFDERAGISLREKDCDTTFEFLGEIFPLSTSSKTKIKTSGKDNNVYLKPAK